MDTTEATCTYQIRIGGELDARWSDWLGGLAITSTQDETLLTGALPDQAALRGVLEKLWDLNLVLIAVRRLDEVDAGKQQANERSGATHE